MPYCTELIHCALQTVEPLRDIFAAMFFTSIGVRRHSHSLICDSIVTVTVTVTLTLLIK